MGLVVLLIACCVIAYVFWRAALSMTRYYKQLQNEEDASTEIRQRCPRFSAYAKIYVPVLIAWFYICSVATMLAFFYFLFRWFSEA